MKSINLIIHHSYLFESSSHQITFNLHYHRHLGSVSIPKKAQKISIDVSELVSWDQGDGDKRGEHFST